MRAENISLKQGPGKVVVNGLELWYTVRGTGPVCFVPSPGWGLSVDEYVSTLSDLAETLTLVFIDSRGSGRSQRPPTTKEYRYADFSSDMECVRRSLGIGPIWVLGHSLGGVLAMQFALDNPAAVAGLLLVDTYGESDSEYRAEVERRRCLKAHEPWFKRVDWPAVRTDEQLMAAVLETLPLYFHDYRKMQESLDKFSGGTCSIHAYQGWRDSEACEVHLLPRLPAIRCPTLLIAGENDFICSPMNSERIQGRISRSELKIVREAGHFPWIEQPADFFQAVKDFVNHAG